MENVPTVESLKNWRSQVIKDIENLKSDLAVIQMKLNESLERLELIDQLLDLEGIDLDVNVTNLVKPLDLLDSCEAIIRKSGKPLHIKELHSALVEIGANIPGKGNMANVISRIQRSNGRVIRTGKGMYGLPEFGLPEIKPTKKLRKPN